MSALIQANLKSLSLDPSVNNVGYSVFDPRAKTKETAWEWGTWNLHGNNLEMRIMDLMDYVIRLQEHSCPEGEPFAFLITEKPAFYSSEKGHIAAHMNYTIDLAAINYFVAGWLRRNHRQHFAITATQWKGSVSKLVTARKFFRCFPKVNPRMISEHAIDAAMLHRFWIQEYLLRMPLHVCNVPEAKLLSLL